MACNGSYGSSTRIAGMRNPGYSLLRTYMEGREVSCQMDCEAQLLFVLLILEAEDL